MLIEGIGQKGMATENVNFAVGGILSSTFWGNVITQRYGPYERRHTMM
jgi:hypothetical protein